MDLYNELTQKIKELNISIKKLRETGTEYADNFSVKTETQETTEYDDEDLPW